MNLVRPALYLYLWVLLLTIDYSYAQEAHFRFEKLSVENGLSQSYVTAIVQDKTGFIWFGTADGLNRFDGYNFTVFKNNPSISHSFNGNIIYALLSDKKNRLWVGTRAGLDRYDPATKQFTHFTTNSPPKHRLPNGYVYALHEDYAGRIWIGTGNNAAVYNPEKDSITIYDNGMFGSSFNENVISAFYEDAEGSLWVGGGRGLWKYSLKTWETRQYHLPKSINQNNSAGSILTITQNKNGDILCGTFASGIYVIRKGENDVKLFLPKAVSDETGQATRALLYDQSQRLWIATTEGLSIYNEADGTIQNFRYKLDDPDAINFGSVTALCLDNSGQLWVGTDGGGISKVNTRGKNFGLFRNSTDDRNSLSDNFIKSIYKDSAGVLWVGTRKGLNRYNQENKKWKLFRHHQAESNAVDNLVLKIFEDKSGVLWIGHILGLSTFNRDTEKFTNSPFLGLSKNEELGIHDIIEIDENNLLIAAWSGLYNFNKIDKYFKRIKGYKDRRSLVGIPFYALHAESAGEYWAGSLDSGLYVLDKNFIVKEHFQPERNNPNSISSTSIKAITSIEGKLYIATTNGLNLYKEQKGIFELFDERNGFMNSFIYGVLPDKKENLWLSHNKGLTRFNTKTRQVRNYLEGEGLQSAEFNTGAFFCDSEGILYFGGIKGITWFRPESIKDNTTAPPVVLTDFKIFDQSVELPGDISRTQEIILDYSDKIFSFQFAALEFTQPSRNRYAYKMEGFEKEWIYPDRRREVRYTNLEDGEYTFKVKAANADGIWNDKGLSVKIVIRPPFWKKTWFLAIAFLLTMGSFAGIVRYLSYRKLKKKIENLERAQLIADERTRISKDLHDEIGAQVTQISLFGEILKRELPEGLAGRKTLDNITDVTRGIAVSLEGVVWAVNPQNDSLENFIGYIEQYVTAILEKALIICHLDILVNIPERILEANVRHNVLMVIKEIVNNIIKHSAATEVWFKIQKKDEYLVISIKDNGKGFKTEEIRKYGNGLNNIKKRIGSIGGFIDFQSKPDSGTEFIISLHLLRYLN